MISLKVRKIVNESYAYDNILTHNKSDFYEQTNVYIRLAKSNTVYPSIAINEIEKGSIGLGGPLRTKLDLAFNESINVMICQPSKTYLLHLSIQIVLATKNKGIILTHEDEMKEKIINSFKNYYFSNGQVLIMLYGDKNLILNITTNTEGYINEKTQINLSSSDSNVNFMNAKLLKRDLFRDNYNFEEIGIGGLDKELISAFRRALSTRAYKQETIEKLGIKHVKGILLHGPPGNGKTLIARKIGNMISNKEPKVVSGPEIMDKYVGNSEKNIRDLFSDAEKDVNCTELHVIIFDEIDAICRTRGRNGVQSGVTDSIVTQLLTQIDGVRELNNIFIIAMTNRKDLIDEALLRAGRIEVHIEIGLPDNKGREQIFKIHTNKMRTNKRIDKNVNINMLSDMTENYSGAEIESVVKNAASRALHEQLSSDKEIKDEDIIVNMNHFVKAVDEVIPLFGNINKKIITLLPRIYTKLSNEHEKCYADINIFLCKNKRLKTILLFGENGTGKTTLAMKIANDSRIKCIRIIRPIDMISFDENMKALHIADNITNSYIAEESLILLDDIEIAINYAKLGNNITFSNKLYQTLVTLLKTEPSGNHRLTLLVTCSDIELAEMITSLFDLRFDIGNIKQPELFNVTKELGYSPISVQNSDMTIRQLLNSL